MHHHVIGLSQQVAQRQVAGANRLLGGGVEAGALEIHHIHFEGTGTPRHVAADFPQPDNSERGAQQRLQPGDASEVRIADVAGPPRPHRKTLFAQRAFFDHAVEFADAFGERQHERAGLLRHRHIDDAPLRRHRNAARRAGGQIDVRRERAEFMHDGETRGAVQNRGVDGQALHHDAVGVRDLCREIGRVGGKYHLCRIKPRQPRPQPVAPAKKIRLVVGKKFRHRMSLRFGR